MKPSSFLAFSVSIVFAAGSQPVQAKAPVRKQLAARAAQTDAGVMSPDTEGAVAASDAQVSYRPAPAGIVRYSDGVMVRRNPDGSVDVIDEDDAPQSFSNASAHAARHAPSHSAKKSSSPLKATAKHY